MLRVVIALALVIGSVQCAVACTPVACEQSPCHHHKQAPACKHELIPATVVQPSMIGAQFAAPGIEIPIVCSTAISTAPFQVENLVSPDPPIPLRTVLRI